MTEPELKSQRNKARAALELAQMKVRSGLVSPAELEQIRQNYQALLDYQPPAPAVVPAVAVAADEKPVDLPQMPLPEFTRLLEELTLEKSGYHKEMAMRCNRLKDIPDTESAKDLVDEIDRFYDLRTEVAIKINYLKANGRLPQDVGEAAAEDPEVVKLKFLDNLPADKYELAKKLQLARPNLTKARTALERAKDPVKQQHYREKVARLEMEVALVQGRLAAMS